MKILLKNKWNIDGILSYNNESDLLDCVLDRRGILSSSQKSEFLKPNLHIMHDPFLFFDMEKACKIVIDKVLRKEKIIVYGDYDVDGITSTSLLYLFLQKIGADVDFLIPDRILDGYGLTEDGVSKICETNASLIITVDCGITSIKEVLMLKEKNINVIITDHHECKEELPQACAVINPKREGSRYPFRSLAGVGVALKLVQALCISLSLGDLWTSYLDIVALGTIADMVSLTDENRNLVYHGLIEINQSQNIGIRCLLNASELKEKEITTSTIGYAIAPKINAAGRMGDSKRAVRLLASNDYEECEYLVRELLMDNKRRQEVELEIFEMAKSIIQVETDLSNNEIIVVHHKGWNQGVIGIVASKLVEIYHRPVIVLTQEDGVFKGSARSYGDVSILDAIKFADKYVQKYGGHQKACGLVVNETHLVEFKNKISLYSQNFIGNEILENTINIDFEIPFEYINLESAKKIAQMAPFGEENKQPLFVSRNMLVENVRFLSGGKHTKLSLSNKHSKTGDMIDIDAIAFGFNEKDFFIDYGENVDIVYTIDQNQWNGFNKVQIIIKDIRKSKGDFENKIIEIEQFYKENQINLSSIYENFNISVEDILPQKTDYNIVYQFLKASFSMEQVVCDIEILVAMLKKNCKIIVSIFKLLRIFDIFKEVGLINMQTVSEFRIKFQIVEMKEKVSLSNSKTYKVLNGESV